MCERVKVKDYPGLVMKATEAVRLKRINPALPGYEMLIKAIVIYIVEGPTNLYDNVADETSVIPGLKPLTEGEEERHPVKQYILEAMRSVGNTEEDVKGFIADLANYCK